MTFWVRVMSVTHHSIWTSSTLHNFTLEKYVALHHLFKLSETDFSGFILGKLKPCASFPDAPGYLAFPGKRLLVMKSKIKTKLALP